MASLGLLARRILREPCRASTLGDSRVGDIGSTQMCTAWHSSLKPVRWSGWGGSGLENGVNLSGGIWGFINHASVVARGLYYTPSGGAADVNVWPCHFGDLPFPGDQATDTTFAVPYSDIAKTAQFNGGDWTFDPLTCKWMVYRSTGTTLGIPNVGSYTRRIPSLGGGTDTGSNILTNGYNILTQPLDLGSERADLLLDAANPNIVETGKNIYIMGWRKYRDELGLQMSFCGVGGSVVADHINTGYVSDTAIAKYVELYNLNTCIFLEGHNEGTINTTWRDNYAAWIQRWRAAIGSGFRGLILSDYQTTTNTAARVAQMEAYLSEIAGAAGDVALLRLGSIDGGYAKNNGLLADGVHTTAAGAAYFTGLVNQALLNGGGGRHDRVGRLIRGARV